MCHTVTKYGKKEIVHFANANVHIWKIYLDIVYCPIFIDDLMLSLFLFVDWIRFWMEDEIHVIWRNRGIHV